VTVKCKIQLVEIIIFTKATVMKTTEAAASVASNVATALNIRLGPILLWRHRCRVSANLAPLYKRKDLLSTEIRTNFECDVEMRLSFNLANVYTKLVNVYTQCGCQYGTTTALYTVFQKSKPPNSWR